MENKSEPVRTFITRVNHDPHPALPTQGDGDWLYVDPAIKSWALTSRHIGTQEVTYQYVEFEHEPTTQEVIDRINATGENPDYGETVAFHKAYPNERKVARVFAICGQVVNGHAVGVRTEEGGLELTDFDLWPRGKSEKHSLWLVVSSRKPV